MSSSMVHYLTIVKAKRTVIDDLILSEQTVNLFGGLFPVFMLLRLLVPSLPTAWGCNAIICVITETIVVFAFFHRAIAGCGIAGMR